MRETKEQVLAFIAPSEEKLWLPHLQVWLLKEKSEEEFSDVVSKLKLVCEEI